METPLTLIGIEVPRSPQLRGRGEHRSIGEWEVAGTQLLECSVAALSKIASPGSLTLISGEPDQAVYELVQKHRAAEADLMTWIYGITDRARAATVDDVVIFMRSDVLLRDFSVLEKAVEAIRVIDSVHRVEAAYRPKHQPLEKTFYLDVDAQGNVVEQRLHLPKGELGHACPAFEVHRLRNFNLSAFQAPSLTGSAFLWIEEDDFTVLETPLDFLRAEGMLHSGCHSRGGGNPEPHQNTGCPHPRA